MISLMLLLPMNLSRYTVLHPINVTYYMVVIVKVFYKIITVYKIYVVDEYGIVMVNLLCEDIACKLLIPNYSLAVVLFIVLIPLVSIRDITRLNFNLRYLLPVSNSMSCLRGHTFSLPYWGFITYDVTTITHPLCII